MASLVLEIAVLDHFLLWLHNLSTQAGPVRFSLNRAQEYIASAQDLAWLEVLLAAVSSILFGLKWAVLQAL